MASKSAILFAALAVTACGHTPMDIPERGVESVNVPVVARSDYVFDAAAPDGSLSPYEAARLNGWFAGMDLGYGDTIYIDGPFSEGARSDIARLAGEYGLMVAQGAPVTGGVVPPGMVRVIVSRTRAFVPNCPNWSMPSQPNPQNRMHSNFGCGVNANIAAMVANPQDLVHGREGPAAVDAATGAKAITMYRNWPLTAVEPGQKLRPLRENSNTLEQKKDD